ncbi:MAG: F0F1 ATP synthase subunit alpha, partial [Candidatus Gracilibacteria bacterium]|nr:F0F1 ATP synthase subunit alpha [Candidatus Gracilibacteria bacterium]
LDLAQYRELAAFAQFGSDLDAATQAQLTRGARLVEILKQPQYQPLSMEKQVTILFAGTKGLLDTLPVDFLGRFEKELYAYIDQKDPAIFATLKEKEIIDADLQTKMNTTIGAFVKEFKSANGINGLNQGYNYGQS